MLTPRAAVTAAGPLILGGASPSWPLCERGDFYGPHAERSPTARTTAATYKPNARPDGAQFAFGASDMWWESQSREGEGDPPCLRKPLVKVPVEVGFLRVAGPDGGWQEQVVWVRCD